MKLPKWMVKVGLKWKDASPDILVGFGVVAIVGGSVWACVNTAKHLNDICDGIEEEKEEIAKLPEEDQKLAKRDMCLGATLDFVKLYVGPVAVIGLGITSIGVGFGQMKKRYLAMTAAYNSISQAYETYRRRIREEYGEDADMYGRYGLKKEKIVEEDEDGNKKETERLVGSEDLISKASPYARVINQDAFIFKECGGSPIHIRAALEQYEQMLNTMYYNGQPVYYNDIIKWIFGYREEYLSDDGQITGWYQCDPENEAFTDDSKPINLRISTFFGKKGDDDPYDQDMVYIMIDPNVAGPVSLSRGRDNKTRVGGKYLSTVNQGG